MTVVHHVAVLKIIVRRVAFDRPELGVDIFADGQNAELRQASVSMPG